MNIALPSGFNFDVQLGPASLAPSALVKQASDRRIIDPAETSHVQKKANVFRKIRVTILTPQMSNLMIEGSTKPQIFAEKTTIF